MGARVLVVDGGGRGHALAWKLQQSASVERVYCCPGNAGTAAIAVNVAVDPADQDALVKFAQHENIELAVIGSEDHLAAGLTDRLRAAEVRVFGPTATAAHIESSKAFAKHLMCMERIPTAPYAIFMDFGMATRCVRDSGAPLVVKASGLSAGKGAFVCQTEDQAEQVLRDLFIRRTLGAAGDEVIVERFLSGPEVSVHALCDGQNAVMLPCVQDHKAVFDGGQGPNTGGMGTYGPVPFVDGELQAKIRQRIIGPTLRGMRQRSRDFQGCLFPGLKLMPSGPFVLEYNARFGDPETQVLMRLFDGDLYKLLLSCAAGNVDTSQLAWHDGYAVCVVMASDGYPGRYQTGYPISGIAAAEQLPEVRVFHAGTKTDGSELLTAGGRVLCVTARGSTLRQAVDRAYAGVSLVSFEGAHYRTDIGANGLS